MPEISMLSIGELRQMLTEDGPDAVRSYYDGCDAFILILSDGYSTHVSWSSAPEDSDEFEITPATPPDGNDVADIVASAPKPSDDPVFDDTELGATQVFDKSKLDISDRRTTRRVRKVYFSPHDTDVDLKVVVDSKSMVVPLTVTDDSLDVISIGRGGFNDIKLNSSSVSAIHAMLLKSPDGSWGIMDRGSKNGTMVDGASLEPNKLYTSLVTGKEIVFADIPTLYIGMEGLLDLCQ